MNIPLYQQDGSKKGTLAVADALFEQAKPDVIAQVLRAQQLGARTGTAAHTKTRAEVRGGGRKPWRQKGTGRARAGSIRSPIFRGGGVTHGPRGNRNFQKHLPKKLRKKALRGVLFQKKNHLVALENFEEKAPKTKIFANFLAKVGASRRVLVLVPSRDEVLLRSARNIPGVSLLLAGYLNVRDLLAADHVVLLSGAESVLEQTFSPTSPASE